MSNQNMINIGSPERPVLVSKSAIDSDSDRSREFWEMVVNGSVDLGSDEALSNLLKLCKDNEETNGIK